MIIYGEIIPPGAPNKKGGTPAVKKMKGVGADPVNKVSKSHVVNRQRSTLQHMILNVLHGAGQPIGGKIGHLPRTGDIIDAIGLPRTKSTYASVSRSLARLEAGEWIVSYQPELSTRGNGRHYGVKP